MGVIKIRGIVLKEIENGESSKQIVVLAKGIGKVLLSARGAKKPKSKLLAGTQLFCCSDFLVYEGRGFYSITQVDLIDSFYNLRTDIEKLAHCMYLMELLERTCLEGMEQDEALELLYRTLRFMESKDANPKLAARIFELKYLQICGFMPEMERCATCGDGFQDQGYFSAQAGGMVCQSHKDMTCMEVSVGTQKAMNYVFDHEIRYVFGFCVSEDVLQELGDILREYMMVHMNVGLKTRSFAENL